MVRRLVGGRIRVAERSNDDVELSTELVQGLDRQQDKVSQVEPGTWLVAGSGKATYQVRTDKPASPPSDTLEFSRPKLVCQCP